MKKLKNSLTIWAWVLILPTTLMGQVLPLQNDPGVRTGKLKNGFRYFVKHNEEPKGRAIIYLANNVGSILETNEEQGIAHFIEHMNFNGTKHFPKNDLISYLERSGVKFGADLNAFTTADETVYQLPLPTNDAALWKNGMLMMRDWAADATLNQLDFDQERGVIREEKRLRSNALGRIGEQYRPVLYNYSRYADRMPIGKDEVINKADVSVARNFYKKWYRPDLQALIIVGDIKIADVEQQIIKLFSDLKMPVNPAKRPQYPIALRDSSAFVKITDPEFGQYLIQYYFKTSGRPMQTESDFREQLIRQLTNALYGNRLREVFNSGKLPYLVARAQIGELVANLDALTLSVSLNPEQIKPGFKAFWLEMERVKRYGFTVGELQSAKDRLNRALEMALSEKDKTSSVSYANEYLGYFTKGDAYLSIGQRAELVKRYITQISSADIKQYLTSYLNSADQTIVVLGPEKATLNLPDKGVLSAWQNEVTSGNVAPFLSGTLGQTLLTHQPVSGKIVREDKILQLGVIRWQLSNGMNVYVKPTNFKNDEVLFSGFSQGGTSLYDMADFYSAKNASAFISSSGLGRFNANQLNSFLNSKAVQVKPFITDRSEGISGVASVRDLPVAMEMVYAYMTEPRLDTARFGMIIDQSRAAFRNRTASPDRIFTDTITKVLGGNHPRRQPASIADLDKIDSGRMHAIFKERFANAADFNFVFTGNVQIDSLKAGVERYLASLPTADGKEVANDLKIRIPEGRLRKDMVAGTGDKASVQIVLSGKYEYNNRDNLYLDLLKSALNFRLTERLREKEGGVYSPAVYVTKAKKPLGFYALVISFDCDPAKMEQLIKAARDEVFLLARNGVNPDDLKKFQAEETRGHELALRSNDFWLSYLQEQIENDESLTDVLKTNETIEAVNRKESISYGNRFLNNNNEIIFTIRPQKF